MSNYLFALLLFSSLSFLDLFTPLFFFLFSINKIFQKFAFLYARYAHRTLISRFQSSSSKNNTHPLSFLRRPLTSGLRFPLHATSTLFSSCFIHVLSNTFSLSSHLFLTYLFTLQPFSSHPLELTVAAMISFIISYRLIVFIISLSRHSLVFLS